ncbi:MAG: hypothetical protein WBB45_12650 [Cyclobacteriaceae bacterium]
MITTLHDKTFRPGQKDRLVGRLHRILSVRGYLGEMPGNPNVFSRTTQKVLARYQKRKRQQPTGLLNKKTAILLEEEYVKSGYGRPYRIKGVVKSKDTGKGVGKLEVEAWVMQNNKPKQVAAATSDVEGDYQLEFDEISYADLGNKEHQHATFLIRVDKDNKMLERTEPKNVAPGDYTVNIELGEKTEEPVDPIEDPRDPIDNPDDPADPGSEGGRAAFEGGVIRGKVMRANRQPVSGLFVQAFDKNIREDVTLGKVVTTNRSGDYEIIYSADELPAGKEYPDLYLQVMNESGKALGQSTIKYNAPAEAKINVLLSPESLPEDDEYTHVKKELQGYLNGLSLADLQEDDQQQDITYLANKSGWDARIVAMASLAEKYGNETDTPAPFYYALFRAGYPTDRNTLSKAGTGSIGKIWEEAGKQNIINQELETQISKGKTTFASSAASHLLKQPAESGISSLNDMLNVANLNEEAKLTFTRLYIDSEGDANALWKNVDEALGQETGQRLRIDGKLGYLT